MNHDAVYALYPNVVTVDDGAGAFDAQGNKVEIDLAAVAAWVNPNAYKQQRATAYPTIAEQLDLLYWDKVNGTNKWAEAIDAVKQEFPKP